MKVVKAVSKPKSKESEISPETDFYISRKPVKKRPLQPSDEGNENKLSAGDNEAQLPSNEGIRSSNKNTNKSRPSDTSEGRTIFIRNLSFDLSEDSLSQFFSQFGRLEFVKIVKDKMTQHSRGSAFAKFCSKEDADNVLLLSTKPEGARKFTLAGRQMQLSLAVSREEIQNIQKSRNADGMSSTGQLGGRNLHLARIGMIRPGTKAAESLTPAEAAMREALARAKRARLERDSSIFVSPTRLCLRNLPRRLDDRALRKACQAIIGRDGTITECRIMRDLKSGAKDPKSLGFAFVAFDEHADALKVLQTLNNNSSILGGTRKPIVEFSLENSRALEKKRRRQEKSQMALERQALGNATQKPMEPVGASKWAKKAQKRKRKNKVKRMGAKVGPMRVMPKKLGAKVRHKQRGGAAGKKSKRN